MATLFSITTDDLRKLARRYAAERALSPQETEAFEAYCIERVLSALEKDLQDEVEYFLGQFELGHA
jgi:hypothetical protein